MKSTMNLDRIATEAIKERAKSELGKIIPPIIKVPRLQEFRVRYFFQDRWKKSRLDLPSHVIVSGIKTIIVAGKEGAQLIIWHANGWLEDNGTMIPFYCC